MEKNGKHIGKYREHMDHPLQMAVYTGEHMIEPLLGRAFPQSMFNCRDSQRIFTCRATPGVFILVIGDEDDRFVEKWKHHRPFLRRNMAVCFCSDDQWLMQS